MTTRAARRDISERYEIVAKTEGDPAPEMMRGPMLQALLEDRFSLRFHREEREVPVYALTVAKGGLKLQEWKEGNCTPPSLGPPPEMEGKPRWCGFPGMNIKGPNLTMDTKGVTLDEIAKGVLVLMDRPVINRTGITGRFDLHLEFAPDQSTPGMRLPPTDDSPEAPSIFTAIQQQLGLKLEPTRGPGEFLVIDHVERRIVHIKAVRAAH